MSIYTKTGDLGTTATFGGKRVTKCDLQIEAGGALDEATSFIGLVITSISGKEDVALLSGIQEDLYAIMAYLAGGPFEEQKIIKKTVVFEKLIDELESSLPKLTRFILPQGSEQSARIHVSRAVVRSAERRVVAYLCTQKQRNQDPYVLQYLNRLSDLLFMIARKYTEREILT